MPSPFPGMDPYLEAIWRDVHTRFIVYMSEALQDELPEGLRARIEERVVLAAPDGWGRQFIPDIYVHEAPRRKRRNGGVTTAVATVPIVVDLDSHEAMTESFIEIVDRATGEHVVTVIELLSRTNKRPGTGQEEYLKKQADVLQSDANLVEIDLLRSGAHTVALPEDYLDLEPCRYLVCVRRTTRSNSREIYPIQFDQTLPTIRIPLRPSDSDIQLNLQKVLATVYARGQYDLDIDYSRACDPPLVNDFAKWADALLRKAGLRPRQKPPRRRKKR